MLKKCILLVPFVVILLSLTAFAAEPTVSAKSAVLIDAQTGRVIFAKNENERLPMASTTKIMTSLITLEEAAKDDKQVTITDQMVRVEGSSMGLLPGNIVTLKTLATGMLTVSGNDAANSAAYAIAGSPEAFAKLMNNKALELGLTNTHFVTPSGLDAPEHYSSAYDMALLGAAAMKNPDFAAIASQKTVTVGFINPKQNYRFTNHNRLLSMYDGCIGIKTGFTKKSGRCLVSAAERNGIRLIAVTLDDPDDWNDHEKLYDYGFSFLSPMQINDTGVRYEVPVVGGLQDNVMVAGTQAEDITIKNEDSARIVRTVEMPSFVYAPVRNGQVLGRIRYTLDGETLALTDLIAVRDVDATPIKKNFFERAFDTIKGLFGF